MSSFVYFWSYVLTLLISLPGIIFSGGESINDYKFEIDASQAGEVLPNVVSNVNVWNMKDSTQFSQLKINEKYNIGEFVEYVQLMQCTGGNASRDLFVDPYNFDVLDDYDFSPLIENCKGIVALGAKPHLKLGSVPLKYSSLAREDEYFGTNVYPPDDYDVYHNYMSAMAQALVDEFGKEEVLKWRFGVMTEYENDAWFKAVSGDPQESAEQYCKLYDYTVDALQSVIGENVIVGAHSMTVTEGLWDEKIFINHCANGTNHKTGKTGSRICFLNTSFYDARPGEYTSGYTLPESIGYLKTCAQEAGLEGLTFGVDEGRLLYGLSSGSVAQDLNSRAVGYTYQAAYDARIYKQLYDCGGEYFSSWYYLSGGLFEGNPSVSYHVARNIAKFGYAQRVAVEKLRSGVFYHSEVDCVSAYDAQTGTLRIMAYNFKNDIDYEDSVDLKFTVNVPQFAGRNVSVTVSKVDDNCNFFDEWVEDRAAFNIGDDCFAWSPDCFTVDSYTTLNNAAARELYFTHLYDKYTECSTLTPASYSQKLASSELIIEDTLAPNGVVFYEVKIAE